MAGFEDELNLCRTFGERLKFHLSVHGTRPDETPDKKGRVWGVKEFAGAVGKSDRSVQNWLNDRKCPPDVFKIQSALFGANPKLAAWKTALRNAHSAAKARTPDDAEDETDPLEPPLHEPGGSKPIAQILHPEIRPVPGFTGRVDLLPAIDRALWQKGGGTAALTNAQSAAVHGLGGVGKSALAQEYAWRNRARYRGVWWLRAETEQTLLEDLIALGSRLIPGLAEIPERDRAAQLTLDAIEQTSAEKPWLLVYDNAEKPAALGKLTPRSGAHRLITSRWPRWQGHAEALAVDVFPPDVAIDYLTEDATHPDRDAAARLAEALGRLPLALAHARAYCASSNLPFHSYRARIAERIKDLPDGADYPASVFATFSLAMDKAVAICTEAETLMAIAAFLAPDRIPLDLITADVIGEDELNLAVTAVYNVSLITHETLENGSRGFTVHRLVQEVMLQCLGDCKQEIQWLALRLIKNALAASSVWDHTNWPLIAVLVPHGVAALNGTPDDGDGASVTEGVCAALGSYFCARADYANALPHSQRALAIREKTLGPNHPNVAHRLEDLGYLLRSMSRYDEAEPLLRHALVLREKVHGPNHPDVGTSRIGFGMLLQDLSRYDEAESLFRHTLSDREKMLGADHPALAECLIHLGALLRELARYDESELLLRRALLLAETEFGPDHPNVGMYLVNLAMLLCELSRYDEAEPLYRRSLAIAEETFWPDHPDIGRILNDLAELFRNQSRYEEAEPLYNRAIAIREKTLGPDHADFGTSLNNFALLRFAQSRYDDAELLFRRALAITENAFGPDHPYVGIRLNNLAQLLHDRSDMMRPNRTTCAHSRYGTRRSAPSIRVRKGAERVTRN